jgi:preprotein translocase subunit Sss1
MSDTKSPIEEAQQQLLEFKVEAEQFWNRSTKYDQKQLMVQLKRTGMALGALGVVGYGVKLVCLPLVQLLVGA